MLHWSPVGGKYPRARRFQGWVPSLSLAAGRSLCTLVGIQWFYRLIPARVLGSAKVVEGSKYDGKAGDIWSCAVVLFTMLAGFSPFKIDAAEVQERDIDEGVGQK